MSPATARAGTLYDTSAARYDRKISIPERLLVGAGRQCAADQAFRRPLPEGHSEQVVTGPNAGGAR